MNTATINGHPSALTVAGDYITRGWAPIPVPYRQKRPLIDEWEKLRITAADLPNYFRSRTNIGVLNGAPSGWLVDVDLDHPLARELADEFLPVTQSEFGRASSHRSHRLYVVTGPVDTLQRKLPKIDGQAKMIVELRSTGSQTVFPGSIHAKGERIEWESDGEPAKIAPEELLKAVNALADEVKKRIAPPEPRRASHKPTGPSATKIVDRARKYLGTIPPAVSGAGGHSHTFHVACVLTHGFALERGPALELLSEWNQTCQPPWTDRELEHKIDDAIKEEGERGYLLNGKSSERVEPSENFTEGKGSEQFTDPKPGKSRHTTDVGNAERFAEQHGADVRYCHPWSKWLVWDGRRWRVDDCGEVMRRAKLVARSIYIEASEAEDSQQREALAKWASASERRERLNAMIALAQSEQPIPIAVEALDADGWLLNCENGTLCLRTGELREHQREDFLTKLCPIEYPTEPGIDAVLWTDFLDRIFKGNARLIGFLQRLVGMSLVGEVLENILPILHGVGANGKSVFLETICGMLGGDYAMAASTSLLMVDRSGRHPTERTDLHGKRLVAANESGDGGRLSEETVKQLTSREGIRARRMREDNWEFTPSHSVFLATNHKPEIRGTDYGIWRRIHLIPFSVTIPPEERDKELANKLKAEWPAILRWAVAGCVAWRLKGLQAPEEVVKATDGYRADMDVLGEFLEERCILDDECAARAADLYRSYKAWSEKRGEHIESQKRFGTRVTERGFEKGRDGGNLVIYKGIGLLTPEGPEGPEGFSV